MACYPDFLKPLRRRDSYEYLPPNMSEPTLVLLGNSSSLTASVGNLLLGKKAFTLLSHSFKCEKGTETFKDKAVTVIVAPEELLTSKAHLLQQHLQEIKDLSSSGPRLFLLVLQLEDFTEEHNHKLQPVLEGISKEAINQGLVLLFRPKQHPEFSESYMRAPQIQNLIRRCRYRHMWMDHTDLHDLKLQEFKQKELFSRISDMWKSEPRSVDTGLTFSPTQKPALNVVLVGSPRAGKTKAAEFILGRSLPEVISLDQCVKHEGEVLGHQVSVVELPTLSGKPPEKVMELCFNCISLCPEGVHAFINVKDSWLIKDQVELKILLSTLSTRVKKFIVDLDSDYYYRDLSDLCQSVSRKIRNAPDQVLNVISAVDKREGSKVYTNNMFVEALIEKVPKSPEMYLSSEGLRIALIGKRGSGKRATANTILGEKYLVPEASEPKESEKVSRKVQGRTVTVMKTPPLFGDSFSEELSKCMSQLAPGPHAFLLLLPIGNINEEDQSSLQMIQKSLGEKASDYVMIVFTKGDQLSENYTLEKYIEECGDLVKNMLQTCGNRFHVINKTKETNDKQALELLQKIDLMVQENGAFTQEMMKVKETQEELEQTKLKMKEVKKANKTLEQMNEEVKKENTTLEQMNEEVKKENTTLEQMNEEVKLKMEEVKKKNKTLEQMNEEVKLKMEKVKKENKTLEQINEELKKKNTTLEQINEELKKKNTTLEQMNEEVKKENTTLEQFSEEVKKENTTLEQMNEEVKLKMEQTKLKMENWNQTLEQMNEEVKEGLLKMMEIF